MPRTLTARFETEEEAERALAAVASEIPLRDSAVLSSGLAGTLTLDSLQMSPEERAGCEQQLSKGGFLLVAQVASESRGEAVLRLLDGLRKQSEPQAPAVPQAEPEQSSSAASGGAGEAPEPVAGNAGGTLQETVREERVPILEEELRIGKREVVRGRSRIHAHVAEIPVQEQVELLHEETYIERRPVNRRLSDEEVAQGGLLQERVIEVTEMREEPVVRKEAFVREELIVTKKIHRRTEQVEETIRRTEVETERLPPEDEAMAEAETEGSLAEQP